MCSTNSDEIPSACILFFVSKRFCSPIESFCVYLRQKGWWNENVKTDFFRCDVNSARSVVIGNTALQRALAMMQVSGQFTPVSVFVLIWRFTFELHLETNANVFRVSGYFCTVGFEVYATASLKTAEQYFVNSYGSSGDFKFGDFAIGQREIRAFIKLCLIWGLRVIGSCVILLSGIVRSNYSYVVYQTSSYQIWLPC